MIASLVFGLALAADPPTVEAAPGKGVTITAADGRSSLRIGGRIQLRETIQLGDTIAPVAGAEDDRLTHLAQVKTARLTLSGYVLSKDVRYTLQLALAEADYRGTTKSPVYDAYLDLTHFPNASVRVGQLFVPFDRARTAKELSLMLAERAIPVTEFNLDRGFGAYLYSDALLGSPVAYRLGVFANNGINLNTAQPLGAIFVARVEVRPLGPVDDDIEGDLTRRDAPGLAIGAAAAYSLDTSRVRSTTGDNIPVDTFDYVHVAGDVVFKWHGLAMLGEFLLRDASVDTLDDPDLGTFHTRSGWGWFGQASYSFVPEVALTARYSDVVPFDGTEPNFVHTHEVGAGPGLYFNGHALKVEADWIATWQDDFGEARHSWHILTDITF